VDAARQPTGLLIRADLQQYFSSRVTESVMAFSVPGTSCRNRPVCSGAQKPITGSTSARFYQLRRCRASSAQALGARPNWRLEVALMSVSDLGDAMGLTP
jgi:hypothetical protein